MVEQEPFESGGDPRRRWEIMDLERTVTAPSPAKLSARTAAKKRRVLPGASSETEQTLNERVLALPTASEEETRHFEEVIAGFKFYMRTTKLCEASIKSYVWCIRKLFLRERRSLETMISAEYQDIVVATYGCKHLHKAALAKFIAFGSALVEANEAGRSTLDPCCARRAAKANGVTPQKVASKGRAKKYKLEHCALV